MPQGTLAVKAIKVDHVPSNVEAEQLHVTVEIAGEKKSAKSNELLNFDLKDVNGSTEVLFEVGTQRKRKFTVVATGATTLSAVQNNTSNVMLSEGVQLIVDGKWTIKNTTQKYAGTNTAQTADTIKETGAGVATLNPERVIAVHEPHRPKYLRALFYYDATKNVYNYSTSFRLLASVARFSEHSANAVLQKVTGKNLHEIDDGVVVPVLSSLDDKVDATISAVLIKLVEGQNYVLQKKNDAVETASTVVDSTWKTVTHAKDYTTSSIYSVSSSAYEKACNVTDYTTSQVVNVSSSTLGTVRNAGVYVVSHVPYLGAKIRA